MKPVIEVSIKHAMDANIQEIESDNENSVLDVHIGKRKRSEIPESNISSQAESNNQIHAKRSKQAKTTYSHQEAAIKIQRTWRRYRINQMITKGTINDRLHVKQVQARFPGLNIDPPLPKHESTIDQTKVTNYLNDITDPDIRELAKKIIDNYIAYLSTDDLKSGIIQSARYLNQLFENLNLSNEVHLLIETGHSSEWVAGIAARYLNITPQSILTYSRKQPFNMTINYDSNIKAAILIIDDIAYSGRQLEQNLRYIAEEHIKNCLPIMGGKFVSLYCSLNQASTTFAAPKQLDIYIVIPFMNTQAFHLIHTLSQDLKKIGINVIFIKPKVLSNIRNCGLSDEELDNFSLLCGESQFSNQSKSFDRKVLVFSSWKKPDFFSTPHYFADGVIPDNLKAPGKPYVQHQFMPDVKPPYYK